MQLFECLNRRIESYREDMIRMQCELTAIPAVGPESGGEGESEKAKYLLRTLAGLGFRDILVYDAPDDRVPSGVRPNIVVTIPGRENSRSVWIMTHMDVVPPGERGFWKSDPYQARVEDGKIYGRGTEDNQQDLVASVFAAKALLDEKAEPPCRIRLAIVSDEEMGSEYGLKYLLKAHASLFQPEDFFVVPDFGNERGDRIEIAEKSILWLRLKTVGKQCHASRPYLGINAFAAGSRLVVRLHDLYEIFNQTDSLYDPPMSTFEPTRKDANVSNVNTIPGEDIFYLDSRILPQYSLADVLSQIRRMCSEVEETYGVSVETTPVQMAQAPRPTPVDAPVVRFLTRAIREVYGVEAHPIGIGGGTVAACLRHLGFPAAVWGRLGHMAHQPNEFCIIDYMVGNAKVFGYLFLCGND
ncbi:MAG TPA: M20 family metallo-hydrolase [Syntrophales bacterium]|nr:M20 family metallo-hydrolase [Syntrophales bacterium]